MELVMLARWSVKAPSGSTCSPSSCLVCQHPLPDAGQPTAGDRSTEPLRSLRSLPCQCPTRPLKGHAAMPEHLLPY